MTAYVWLLLGSINGLIAVLAGAYGRHGALDPGGREMFALASQYQMAHALALLAVAWLASNTARNRQWPIFIAGAAFAIGIVLFSGALYWFGVTGFLPIEGIAPVGGWLLIIGWIGLIVEAARGLIRGPQDPQ